MKRETYICDICGKETDKKDEVVSVSIQTLNILPGIYLNRNGSRFDVCLECLAKMGIVPSPAGGTPAIHEIDELIRKIINEEIDNRQ